MGETGETLKIDRPFDPGVLARAREIADGYTVVTKLEEDWFFGCALELPNVWNDGATVAECIANTRDILTTAIAAMIELGETPPAARPRTAID